MAAIDVCRAERARGTTIGATIMGGFGTAWMTMGMASAGLPTRASLAVVVPVFAMIACFGSVVRHRLPKFDRTETPEKKQMMRTFAAVNVVQWLAIFGTVNLLRNLHLDTWTVPAMVLIVGAHFLPLARIFQARQHLTTGAALMLCAVVSVVLPISIRATVECLSAGLILWVSAAGALHAGFRMTPPSALASQAGR